MTLCCRTKDGQTEIHVRKMICIFLTYCGVTRQKIPKLLTLDAQNIDLMHVSDVLTVSRMLALTQRLFAIYNSKKLKDRIL